MIWLKFLVCLAIIVFFGRKLAIYGDVIAEKTRLGGLWVGLILLAMVTSLPELFTGISAVVLVGAPDLTVGNLFGANAFNLFNLALLDIAFARGLLYGNISKNHFVTAWYSLILVSLVALPILMPQLSGLAFGWVGWYTPVLIILYVIFMRDLFHREQRHPSETVELKYENIILRKVYVYFAVSAGFIIGAGIWLATIGEEIAQVTGLERSFVGSLFLAFTTTTPEITVSFSAMRLGARNMAIANILGSNLFNMIIIAVDDLFYVKGPLLASVSPDHLITFVAVLLMTVVLMLALRSRPKRFGRLSWWSGILIILFLLNHYLGFIRS